MEAASHPRASMPVSRWPQGSEVVCCCAASCWIGVVQYCHPAKLVNSSDCPAEAG